MVSYKHILVLLMGMFLTSPSFSYDPNSEKTRKNWSVGPWEISQFRVKETDEFSHCSMSTTYSPNSKKTADLMKTRNLVLMIKVNFDTSFNFILMGYDWKLNKGKTYVVESRYSTGKIYHIKTTADPEHGVSLNVNFGADGKWTENFMKAEWVEFFIDSRPIGKFNLHKSRDAMTSMLNCYASNTSEGESSTFGEGQ